MQAEGSHIGHRLQGNERAGFERRREQVNGVAAPALAGAQCGGGVAGALRRFGRQARGGSARHAGAGARRGKRRGDPVAVGIGARAGGLARHERQPRATGEEFGPERVGRYRNRFGRGIAKAMAKLRELVLDVPGLQQHGHHHEPGAAASGPHPGDRPGQQQHRERPDEAAAGAKHTSQAIEQGRQLQFGQHDRAKARARRQREDRHGQAGRRECRETDTIRRSGPARHPEHPAQHRQPDQHHATRAQPGETFVLAVRGLGQGREGARPFACMDRVAVPGAQEGLPVHRVEPGQQVGRVETEARSRALGAGNEVTGLPGQPDGEHKRNGAAREQRRQAQFAPRQRHAAGGQAKRADHGGQVGMHEHRHGAERQPARPSPAPQAQPQRGHDQPVRHQRLVAVGAHQHGRGKGQQQAARERSQVARTESAQQQHTEHGGQHMAGQHPETKVLQVRRHAERLGGQRKQRDGIGEDHRGGRLAEAGDEAERPLPGLGAEEHAAKIVLGGVAMKQPAGFTRVERAHPI